MGLPRSRWLGQPQRSITTYTYTDDGHLERAETLTDPGWTREDRDLLVALAVVERDVCPGCGSQRSTAWDPSTAGTWRVTEHVCQACRVRDAVADGVDPKKMRGRYATVRQ